MQKLQTRIHTGLTRQNFKAIKATEGKAKRQELVENVHSSWFVEVHCS